MATDEVAAWLGDGAPAAWLQAHVTIAITATSEIPRRRMKRSLPLARQAKRLTKVKRPSVFDPRAPSPLAPGEETGRHQEPRAQENPS
ncbi:hypothetical protein GCM10010404_69770 [Nonomuraea africana]